MAKAYIIKEYVEDFWNEKNTYFDIVHILYNGNGVQ